jgi:hypothetical protein
MKKKNNQSNQSTNNSIESTAKTFDKKNVVIAVLALLCLISISAFFFATAGEAAHQCPVPTTTENTVHIVKFVPVEVEKIVEVEVEKIVEVEVEKIVEVEVEKIVEVEVEKIVEVEVEKIVEVEVEKIVEIEKPIEIIKEVEKVVEIEKVIEVETPTVQRWTTFVLNESTFTAYWNDHESVDEIIHNILHYTTAVEFIGDGNSMVLTITGDNVVFYENRIEYNGVVVATVEGCQIVNGIAMVVEMTTKC